MPSSRVRAAQVVGRAGPVAREKLVFGMKLFRRSASASDRTFSRLMGLGVLTLAIGIPSFGVLYYHDQHVSAGPSLAARQIAGAEAAVKKAPNNIETRLQLAAAYLQDKRPDDALKQYDEILAAEPTNRPSLLGRGGILIEKGDLTTAAASYHKVTDAAAKGEFAGADPQAQEAHYYLGSIAAKQGKSKVAITELESALKINKTDSDALYLLGVVRLKDGAPQLAVDALKQALLFVPTGWWQPYSQLAKAYGQLGQAPQATYARAMANFSQKRPAEATRQLKTLTTGPVAADALLGLGLIAETANNRDEAVSWYQKVLTVDATNVGAITALSRLGVKPPAAPAAKGSTTKQGKS
jgi:tetratricopeptide (TPR) repeat protein